jgi:putative MATE family efflux protein
MQLLVRDKQFYKKLAAIAIPIAMQNLINFGVNMADTVMVGMLGEVHLSAVALANQFSFIFMNFTFGLASGSNVMVAQFWGKGDKSSIHKALTIMYRIQLLGILVFSYLALFQPRLVMSIFTTDMPVIGQGAEYLRYIAVSYLFAGFASATMIVLRAVAAVKISLVVSISSLCVNVFLNWILIFGKLGAPALGVKGAALATVCARILEVCILLVYLTRFEKRIGYRLRHFFAKKIDLLGEYVRTALPVMFNELLWAFGAAMIAVCIGRMGTAFAAANSICSVLGQLVTIFIFGVANSSAVVIGNTIGAGEYGKARGYASTLCVLSLALGVAAAAVVLLMKNPMISLYNISETARLYAGQIITVHAVIVFGQSFAAISLMGVLRGGGDTRFVLVLDIIFMWVISIPLGFLTGLSLHWPVPAVYAVLKCDELLKSVISFLRIARGRWINDITSSM